MSKGKEIQFIIGFIMICTFLITKYIIIPITETYFEEGLFVGIGGMFLFWGLREVLGSLDKFYKQKIEGKEE